MGASSSAPNFEDDIDSDCIDSARTDTSQVAMNATSEGNEADLISDEDRAIMLWMKMHSQGSRNPAPGMRDPAPASPSENEASPRCWLERAYDVPDASNSAMHANAKRNLTRLHVLWRTTWECRELTCPTQHRSTATPTTTNPSRQALLVFGV